MEMMPRVAVGAVVWKNGKVLLIKRGRAPYLGSWSLPGGRQEAGETVSQAVVREIAEETGIRIAVIDVVAVVDLMDRPDGVLSIHYTVIDVVAKWIEGEAVAADDAAAVVWADPGDLAALDLTAEVRLVIKKARRRLRKPATAATTLLIAS